jgi:3'-phosphoadenosine 5'-phosphosulfate sulfotransferase (PAPS reductase)/FAD synthetase
MNIIKPLSYYDKIIISFSGGKDSLACLLYVLKEADPSKVELWHQSIDGKENTWKDFFDWPSTDGYVKKIAEHFGVYLSYQWRDYGFYGELYRKNQRTNDVKFTRYGSTFNLPSSKNGKQTTRCKWPAKSADLKKRWCSAYLKIDVASRALNNIPELEGKRILFLTGERREESRARAAYSEEELHRTNSRKKQVHHWRPVIDWKEQSVWDIIESHHIKPHPAYFLGFPRLSCRSCIFYNKNHWATLKLTQPEIIEMIGEIEEELNFTLDNKLTIYELVNMGKSKLRQENYKYVKQAITEYDLPVITDNWQIPAGAFGIGGGSI